MVAHPADDRLFLSGSIEGRVRLWNVAEQRVVDDAAVHEMVSLYQPWIVCTLARDGSYASGLCSAETRFPSTAQQPEY